MAIDVNLADTVSHIESIMERAQPSAKAAATAMGAKAERSIKQELAVSSHARGTKTPAPPGAPPSLISGQLRRSVRETKSAATGNYSWQVNIAPTTVYARIQELGGWAGRGHRSHLPPRPYVKPAVARSLDDIRNAAVAVFRKVLGV